MRLFDAHFHIIDPRFPVVPSEGYVPEPFTANDYLTRAKALGICGGAVVAGSFQGVDQGYLLDALHALGPSFVGVTQLSSSITDNDIRGLNDAGVRAVRFNLRRGGPTYLDELLSTARRVYELAGWHAELYVEGGLLSGLEAMISLLPKLVIDHLGLSKEGLPALLRLVEGGAHVKATGFGRLGFNPAPILRDISQTNPAALLFGTDLPSTRAPRPFEPRDIDLILSALGANAPRVLYGNAVALYRPKAEPTSTGDAGPH